MSVRVIARLDIKGPNLVKGIHFEGLRVLGRPETFARHYYETGADELLYMDAVASLYGRNSLLEIVERTSREIFIPLTVGGGLRTVDDIRTVLRAGADKVSLNTAAIRTPELIGEASRAFGSSTVVISVEAIRRADGTYEAYVDYGREATGRDAVAWAIEAAERGAGELVVTSIDREGTGTGFDIELTRRIATAVSIPVIACGGAGRVEHVAEAVLEGAADAVGLASLLHYEAFTHLAAGDEQFKGEGNVEFLQGRRGARAFGKLQPVSVRAVKESLAAGGVEVRPS
jgi:cyclase